LEPNAALFPIASAVAKSLIAGD